MSAPTAPARIVGSGELVADDERTETVKERTWWEVRSRKRGDKWKSCGTTYVRDSVDDFEKRATAEGFEVQVWWVVAVERTETLKKLESRSATFPLVSISLEVYDLVGCVDGGFSPDWRRELRECPAMGKEKLRAGRRRCGSGRVGRMETILRKPLVTKLELGHEGAFGEGRARSPATWEEG